MRPRSIAVKYIYYPHTPYHYNRSLVVITPAWYQILARTCITYNHRRPLQVIRCINPRYPTVNTVNHQLYSSLLFHLPPPHTRQNSFLNQDQDRRLTLYSTKQSNLSPPLGLVYGIKYCRLSSPSSSMRSEVFVEFCTALMVLRMWGKR